MSAAYTYTEFGALIAAGPHRGMLAKTFRSLDAAQRFIDASVEGAFVIRQREVISGDWTFVPGMSS